MSKPSVTEKPFWINPNVFSNGPNNTTIPDKKDTEMFLQEAICYVKEALKHAKALRDYMEKKHPSIDRKSFTGSEVTLFLKHTKKELDSSSKISDLPVAYNCLQRHAVALEQMMLNAEHGSDYFVYLNKKKRSMVSVLSSLQVLIEVHNLRPIPDATRDVMPDGLRKTIKSGVIMRDFFVVQHYTDLIECLLTILENMN